MKNEIIRYKPSDFTSLPKILNMRIEDKSSGDFFCIALEGNEISDDAYEMYRKLMEDFNIGFAFYPYSEAMIAVNRAFGNPNPLLEITLLNGDKINAVRQINYSIMFFDISKFDGMKFDENLQYAFMEKFCDSIASIGAIPSNGMFLDVYESWNYFPKYRRGPIEFNKKFNEEFEFSGIKLDNDTSKMVKHISKIQEKLGMSASAKKVNLV